MEKFHCLTKDRLGVKAREELLAIIRDLDGQDTLDGLIGLTRM